MNRETVFSPGRAYRYTLWREWDFAAVKPDEFALGFDGFKNLKRSEDYVMFIGLNPSTADETKDDPTIRRCRAFAKSWGYGAMCMTNLFAFRATNPKVMMRHTDPVGPDNDTWLSTIAADANLIVAAWGKHGRFRERDQRIINLIPHLQCLRRNDDGTPEHPLYLPKTLTPIPL